MSTSNRYSLLACDPGDHHRSREDTIGGASGATMTALTLQTRKVSQLEIDPTKDKMDNAEEWEQDENDKMIQKGMV